MLGRWLGAALALMGGPRNLRLRLWGADGSGDGPLVDYSDTWAEEQRARFPDEPLDNPFDYDGDDSGGGDD